MCTHALTRAYVLPASLSDARPRSPPSYGPRVRCELDSTSHTNFYCRPVEPGISRPAPGLPATSSPAPATRCPATAAPRRSPVRAQQRQAPLWQTRQRLPLHSDVRHLRVPAFLFGSSFDLARLGEASARGLMPVRVRSGGAAGGRGPGARTRWVSDMTRPWSARRPLRPAVSNWSRRHWPSRTRTLRVLASEVPAKRVTVPHSGAFRDDRQAGSPPGRESLSGTASPSGR